MARSKPQGLQIIVLLAIVLAIIFVRYVRKPGPPEVVCGEPCGTERWRIKTLSDPGAKSIDWNPRHTSISQLVELPAPAFIGDERSDDEKRAYSIEGVLLGWKTESLEHGDRDFHLVLADPADLSRTLIAEIPSSECQGACGSGHAAQFLAAREALAVQLGEPQAHFHRLRPAWVVRVEGVPFFDVYHNQIGVAENCIELHPVVKVEFVRELSPAFPLPRRIEPPVDHRCGRL